MVSKDDVTLSQQIQCIMLHIHQYICFLYKPGPRLIIADWLSQHNDAKNKDQDISGMNISIHTLNTKVDIPIWTSIDDINAATDEDVELHNA